MWFFRDYAGQAQCNIIALRRFQALSWQGAMTKSRKNGGGKAKGQAIKRINGRGAYSIGDSIKSLGQRIDSVAKKIPRGTFRAVGAALGGPKGALIGEAISTVSGYGSYSVDHNSLMTNTQIGAVAENIPSFSKGKHGSVITHREFIRNVVAPANPLLFDNQATRLGIDNTTVFPWLARLSTRYQRYKVKGMVFQYRSTSTDYNNSGTVAIAVNYNATERAYSSMAAVLNSQFACSSKPSVSFYAPVECDPKSQPDGYYIRHEDEINGFTDVRLSSIGVLNVVTNGLSLPAGTVLGELWVTYEVELFNPYQGSDFSFEQNGASVVKQNSITATLPTTWALSTINDSDTATALFTTNDATYNPGADLKIINFLDDANYSRPTLIAQFTTGSKIFLIEYQCWSEVPIDWMTSPSVAQNPAYPIATALWDGSRDVSAEPGNQPGMYIARHIVRFRPGDAWTPPAQGVLGGAQSINYNLIIFRGGN
nr:structural protein [Sobelivirales sp.]